MKNPKPNIFVTGGAGYVGASLVPKLLSCGYKVTVYDLLIFGKDVLKPQSNLNVIKGDIRNIEHLNNSIKNHDAIIHLACISNDPSFDLNPRLGKSINLDCFEPMVNACKNNNVSFFIYASSSSVYGLKKEKDIHENVSPEPLTDYSKYKAECEKILLRHQTEKLKTAIIRPATVFGYSPRQRLDVVVNLLTNQAFHKREIQVLGGEQLRPNIHINDMVDVYLQILKSPISKVEGKIFNAGYQNQKVMDIAKILARKIKHISIDDINEINKHIEYIED